MTQDIRKVAQHTLDLLNKRAHALANAADKPLDVLMYDPNKTVPWLSDDGPSGYAALAATLKYVIDGRVRADKTVKTVSQVQGLALAAGQLSEDEVQRPTKRSAV